MGFGLVLVLVLGLGVRTCERFFVHNWSTNGYTGHRFNVIYKTREYNAA